MSQLHAVLNGAKSGGTKVRFDWEAAGELITSKLFACILYRFHSKFIIVAFQPSEIAILSDVEPQQSDEIWKFKTLHHKLLWVRGLIFKAFHHCTSRPSHFQFIKTSRRHSWSIFKASFVCYHPNRKSASYLYSRILRNHRIGNISYISFNFFSKSKILPVRWGKLQNFCPIHIKREQET